MFTFGTPQIGAVVERARCGAVHVVLEFREQAVAFGFADVRTDLFRREHAFRKATHRGAAVAVHHAAGAVAVDQRDEQSLGVVRISGHQRMQRRIMGKLIAECFAFARIQRGCIGDALGDRRERGVVTGLREVTIEIVEARRIEQAQAREMRAAAELFRRGGQQHHAGCRSGQRFDREIFRARVFGRPFEMMRFVHHQHVPTCGQRLLAPCAFAREPRERNDRKLIVEERIVSGIGRFRRGATFFIDDREGKLEAPAHFDEPLHQQCIGQHDQHARGTAGGQHARDQHAGFDGLAEARFVRQQRTRVLAFHASRDHAKLVRQQVDARGKDAPRGGAARGRVREQGLFAQFVKVRFVHACRHQACIGLRQRLLVVELAFAEFALFA